MAIHFSMVSAVATSRSLRGAACRAVSSLSRHRRTTQRVRVCSRCGALILVAAGVVVLTALVPSSRAPIEARSADPCSTGLTVGDTLRLKGMETNFPSGGELRLWLEPTGRVGYRESWPQGAGTSVWSGTIDA